MKRENYQDFVCGYGAALVNITVTYPLTKVVFRQMVQGISVSTAIATLRRDGISFIYRGMLPPLIQKTTSLSLMFGTYDQFYRYLERSPYWDSGNRSQRYVITGLAAAAAGAVESVLTPFERIQALLQHTRYHNTFQNTFHVVSELRKYGFREFYRGYTPTLIRNCGCNVLFFLLREPIAQEVLSYYPSKNPVVSSPEGSGKPGDGLVPFGFAHFVSGALLGAILSTTFFPLNVCRARMQSFVDGQFRGLYRTFRAIHKERQSFLALWKGVSLNFTRSFLSWGIINSSYELLKKLFFT